MNLQWFLQQLFNGLSTGSHDGGLLRFLSG